MVNERGEHHRPAKAGDIGLKTGRRCCGPWVPSNRRRRALALVAALSLLIAACQGSQGSPTRTSVAERPTVTASPTSAGSSPSPTPIEPRYPNLSKYTDPLDRLSYKLAYSDCRLLGPDRIAEAYGGELEDPVSVARAYAAFVHGTQQEDPAFRGCLDAFEMEG
jgi:hypothetical protein